MNWWQTMLSWRIEYWNSFNMSRSKKFFFVGLGIFFAALIYISIDISRRTSFPGSKSQLKERLKEKYSPPDSVMADSLTEKEKK
jgi:hypothetical protein